MSSRLRRIFRREGTSKLEFTFDSTKASPPTYVPTLVRGKIQQVTDPVHLEKVARLDPLANFIVYGVAEMVFDDWFKLVDKDGNDVLEEAMKQLKTLNAKRVLTQCLAAERWGGWSYLYTGKNKYVPESGEGGRIATLHWFDRINCSVFEYDAVGNPKTMKLNLIVGEGHSQQGKEMFLPAEDFIVWNTRPIGRGYTGRSVLEAIWDMLTYIRELFHSMTFYDMKIGHGLFAAFVHAGFDETTIGKWQTAFEDISMKRALVIDSGDVEKLEFIGPTSNATDFVEHIDMCIQTLSVPIGIPKDLLVGAAQGAISGSETNLKLGENLESKLKNFIEEILRELITRMGFEDTEYEFEWLKKYAHDEEQQSKIAQTEAQALVTKLPILTIDELREIEGYPPLPEGRGDKLASEAAAEHADFKMDVQGLQSPEEEEKTNNPEGKQL